MFKGYKLTIDITTSDAASLGQGSKIKLKLKGYEPSDDKTKTHPYRYTTLFDKGRWPVSELMCRT
jgi:hypothetical protein